MKVLIVEDDATQLKYMSRFVASLGYEVLKADDGKRALTQLEKETDVEVVVTDYKLKEMNGLLLLQQIKKRHLSCDVIIVTAYGNTEDAVLAMKLGAFDYLSKPLNFDELELVLKRAEHTRDLQAKVEGYEQSSLFNKKIIFKSPLFEKALERARKAAETDVTVLLTGESGTGKELVADYIHENSPRRKAPFVKVFCTAIPEGLIETELFGYKKGSFTGADSDRKGKLEYANRSSILLDEISEIPLHIQSKLLRVLQEKEIQRVGEVVPRVMDIKIIATTNKDLQESVRQGLFREDLYYRLKVFPIHLPPLRERKEDIRPLIMYFLDFYNRKYGRDVSLREAELARLEEYHWPGNVRELENLLINIIVSGERYMLKNSQNWNIINNKEKIKTLQELECEHIKHVLKICRGNVAKTAALLGIHRNTLMKKTKELDINLDFYRQNGKLL